MEMNALISLKLLFSLLSMLNVFLNPASEGHTVQRHYILEKRWVMSSPLLLHICKMKPHLCESWWLCSRFISPSGWDELIHFNQVLDEPTFPNGRAIPSKANMSDSLPCARVNRLCNDSTSFVTVYNPSSDTDRGGVSGTVAHAKCSLWSPRDSLKKNCLRQ